jgi:CMP-N,N'-diacetyllegionaminic acid synthase
VELSVLGIIPARGGSKGIYRKNVKPFFGKPLIFWTINAALKAKSLDRFIVSTDDPEIASVSQSLGADVPFLRPPNLAQDNSAGIDSVLHALDMLPNYDWVVLLQPTSPFRSHEDIDSIFDFCKRKGAPAAISISEVDQHPYWMSRMDQFDRLTPIFEVGLEAKFRQDLPKVYALNGAIYLAQTNWLKEKKTFMSSETLGFIMSKEKSLDIDTQDDWEFGEYLMSKRSYE